MKIAGILNSDNYMEFSLRVAASNQANTCNWRFSFLVSIVSSMYHGGGL